MNKPDIRTNPAPSIADLFFVIILSCIFFNGNSSLLGDCDTGYHIRAGEYILRTFSVPKYDIFSLHTPPIPWTAHEWLSEVIMAVVHGFSGLTGVVAFFAFLLALTAYLLFKILRSYQTDILLATVVTSLVVSASQIHWLARPHVFSFLFMLIFHHLLESWYRGAFNRLFLLPPLMLLWVNLHGGFLGGFLLMGAYLAGCTVQGFSEPATREAALAKVRELGITSAGCLAVCLLNPQGYHILLFPFRLVSDTFIMDHICEFLSPDFHHGMTFKYLLLLLVAVFAASRKSIEATELVLVLMFTNMALYSARYIPLFALVTAPILTRKARETGHLFDERLLRFLKMRSANVERIDARARGYLWPLLCVLVVAAAVQSGRFPRFFDPKVKAVAACEFLMREPVAGRMFNNDEIGDYTIYRCYPTYRVFCDGRSDMYGSAMLKEYYKVVNFQPGWEKILDKYGVTWIFFDTDSNFSRFLLRDRDWVLIYSDKVASIFVKNVPQNRRLIEKYRSVKPAVS